MASRTRLRDLVGSLTDEQLGVTLPNGWPIYVALAHVAFWDQRSCVLMNTWLKEGIAPSPCPIDIDAINDTLVPFLAALPPRGAAELAVSCAEAVDARLAQAPDDFIAGLVALGGRFRLYRSDHRTVHLDRIEAALKRK